MCLQASGAQWAAGGSRPGWCSFRRAEPHLWVRSCSRCWEHPLRKGPRSSEGTDSTDVQASSAAGMTCTQTPKSNSGCATQSLRSGRSAVSPSPASVSVKLVQVRCLKRFLGRKGHQ